jgi:hypothetical protein
LLRYTNYKAVMTPLNATLTSFLGAAEQRATRIVFFISGLGTAAWAPLVPFAKARAGLDDGMLGLLLLCLGAGSVAMMPVAGALAASRGCRVVDDARARRGVGGFRGCHRRP